MTSEENLRYTIACLRRKAELEGERGNVLVISTVLIELLDRAERSPPMTSEKMAELRRLAEAATPGPWTHDDGNVFSVPLGKPRRDAIDRKFRLREHIGIPLETGFLMGGQQCDNYDANAEYVAALSPPVLLALLDRIAELERELDERANSADG